MHAIKDCVIAGNGNWVTVYKTVCPMLSVRCPVCLCLSVCVLSVTLVYCGQTVGWIKMKLGTQVGLGPGHIVLDGDPAPPPPKGRAPPIFGPYLVWRVRGKTYQVCSVQYCVQQLCTVRCTHI